MRRALKIIAWFLGGLLLLTLLLVGAAFITGNTDSGRAMIAGVTERLTGGHVKLTGLAGSFPRELTLEKLQLSDDRGVWLTAERVSLRWTPASLLLRRVQIENLRAASVFMERLPESSPAPPNSAPASIPHIDAAAVTIDELKLGPQLDIAPAPLALRGAVHLRSVTDMVIDAAAHRINGLGDYVLHLQFDPKRMDAALKLKEPAGGPLENLVQLPGLGALDATVNLSGLRSAEHLELAIDAGTLRGSAHGNVNVNELSGDLDFAFQSAAMSPRPELAWDSATVQGRWRGSFKAPAASGHFEIHQLRLPGGTALATLSADVTASNGTATLQALAGGLRIPGPKRGLLEDSPLKIDALIHLNEAALPLDVSATHRLFSLNAHAETHAVKGGKRTATMELRLPDLAPLAALGGQKVRGTGILKAQLQSDDTTLRMALDASAALSEGTEIWSAAVGNRAALQVSGALTDKTVTLDGLKFSGRAVVLTASGSAKRPVAAGRSSTPWILRLPWNLNVSDLASVSPALAGTLKASGLLEGPTTAMSGTAQLTSALSVHGTPSGVVTAEAKLRGLPSAPSGSLAAHGTLDGSPLDIEVDLERAQAGSLRALIRRADWKSAHAEGDVIMPPVFAQTHGQLHLKMQQLKDLRTLLGSDIAGSLAGSLEVHPDKGRTHARLILDAPDLAFGGFAGNVHASGDGFTDALSVKLDVKVPNLRGSEARLSAAATLNVDARNVTVASAVMNYRAQNVHLLSPARIDFASGLAVDELKVGAQEAVFELKGRISPTLDARPSLGQVQPALINAFEPGLLSAGTIEARARLRGTTASPTGRVRVTASGMRMANDAALALPALDLQATADLMGDNAQIDAHLSAGSASQLNVAGRAALTIDGTQNLKINGKIDVGLFNPLIEGSGQHTGGQLSVDATVSGSMQTPQIDGTVNLKQGSFADYAHGISVADITADIVGREGKLQIQSFTASAAPGTLSMTGTVGVLQKDMPVDLQFTAKNAQPIASKLVTANLDANLHLTGTARERLDIGGTVNLNRTVVGIESTLPPNVAVLDVRRRGKAAPAPPERQLVIGLNVTLQAPREILVQGRGLDAEVGGELHITGTTDAPLVSGGFDLERGTFSLAGTRLNFTPPGRLSFDGAGLKNKIDPTLDFTAQTTSGDATVTLHITGYADSPQFEFTSSPTLPPDEIMARLLFGQNVSQLSALQAAQIGAALASLSGVGGDSGLNPLVKLQKSLGLDRLNVGAATGTTPTGGASTGASIEAGRYISRRVYVEARQNTTGGTQLETDVDLTKHLKLQTRLGNGTPSAQGTTPENDPGSSVGLLYQFEY
jgi:translocation and assembly module TamB